MSAGAVRQGKVFVEIGADSKGFLKGIALVNQQIGAIGTAVSGLGMQFTAVGSAMTAPLAAAGFAFQNLGGWLEDLQSRLGEGAGIDKLTAEAARLGVVIDSDAARSAMALRDAVTDMGAAIRGVSITIGSALAPGLIGAARLIAEALAQTSKFIRENEQLVRVFSVIAVSLVGVGSALYVAGRGLELATSGAGKLVGPLANIVKYFGLVGINVARVAVAFAVANPVMAALLVVGGGLAAVIARNSDAFAGLGSYLQGAFGQAVNNAKQVLGDLAGIATQTLDGVFNAITSGDVSLAFDILFAGFQASWARGSAALMGVIDPWLNTLADLYDNLGFGIAEAWEYLSAKSTQITITIADGIKLIFMDMSNFVMATFDTLVGGIQSAWIRVQGFFGLAKDVDQQIADIEKRNKERADQRDQTRDAFIEQHRQDVAAIDERMAQNVGAMEQERADRQQRRREGSSAAQAEREQAAIDAQSRLDDLTQRAADAAAGTSSRFASAVRSPAEVAGTFSAMAAGQLGQGTKMEKLAEQQVNILNRIATNTAEPATVGA